MAQNVCALEHRKMAKKSIAGRANRKNDLCRHTGGSIRFDQHRINLDKEEGKTVGYKKVLLQTHATKRCKKMLQDGVISENDFASLEFVTDRAKRSYVAYSQQLKDLYGDVDCVDLDLWKSLHPKCKGRKMFGIGSSDPDFLVTGKKSSTICGSNDDARHSQELQKVQAELEREREARQNIEARFELFQQELEKERADQDEWRKKYGRIGEKHRKEVNKALVLLSIRILD
ncbi:hypothetical protein HanIR_Chr16g0806571 [Helianthus annuus]|nr:hypothetical protein HanIR_Chr16g0806571 [Helianthus annuus]